MKKSVYEIVTEKFIDAVQSALDKGENLTWEKGFKSNWIAPMNAKTKREYHGSNVLLLSTLNNIKGYNSNLFLTFKQIKEMKGKINKGAKSLPVTFWKWFIDDRNIELTLDKLKENPLKKRASIYYYNVFAVEDTDIDIDRLKVEANNNNNIKLETPESIISGYENAPEIKTLDALKCACYIPEKDAIHTPPLSQYDNSALYYKTLFHEMTHSTGHGKRLNRNLTGSKKGAAYSKEELVAEMGSAMLAHRAGLDVDKANQNTTAYLISWLQVLKENPKYLISAGTQAEKAARFILGTYEEYKQEIKQGA